MVLSVRAEQWDRIDASLQGQGKIERNLQKALEGASRAFELLRYSYEGPPAISFFIGDLPTVLGTVAVEIKPEWLTLRHRLQKLPTSPTR